jgi:putative ABC transport system substrate-binding protein
MHRRAFIGTLTGAVLAPLHATKAQRADRIHRIGFISPTTPGPRNAAFLQGLREHGYVEGRDVIIEMRSADGRPERLAGLVEEVIRLQIDVLVVGATIGARAAKAATTTIPIVFAGSSDPVAGGVVANLARPEGNITGISLAYGDGFAGKWLEYLRGAVPSLSRAAVLWSKSNPAAARFVQELEIAARTLDVRLDVHHAMNSQDLEKALADTGSTGARGLVVTPSPFAATHRDQLVQFAARTRLPAMYFVRDFTDVGGLMSYGPSITDTYRRAAAYVDKILKGAKPGDLPIEQPTKFELVVNLKAAKALGLTLPQSLLARADEMIQS